MSITAQQVIEDAYDDIEVKPAETDLTDAEYASGLRRLNRLGTVFAAGGLNFGYTKLTDITQELTIPDWAEDLFVTYLAIRSAPSFGKTISQEVASAALASLNAAQRQLVIIPEAYFPNTLPTGAGNNADGNGENFFTDGTDDDLLDSANNNLSVN